MANPLQAGGTPPEVPMPAPAAQANALAGPTGMPAQGAAQAQQQPQVPAMSHRETVAALRHFDAITRELRTIAKDPALGKSDVKKKIIDGTTQLVSERIITSPQAVQMLGTVPADPQQQRKWVQTHLAQAIAAADAVLDHHAATNPGSGHFETERAASQSFPDNHADDMDGVLTRYRDGGKKRA